MPPKGPGSPKGKKKLSKAEKEKLKKEEAERKVKEEEDARLHAEEEARLNQEREKEEAEERRKLENEERIKRKGQLLELDGIWDSYRGTLINEQTEKRKVATWSRYMRCDGSPNPTIAGEINTYINLWREDSSRVSVQEILDDSSSCLALIEELQFLLENTPEDDHSEEEVTRFNNILMELQDLLAQKLDLASHDLLLHASRLADAETMNLQKVASNNHVTVCLWGNLSKNPRIRSFEFEDQGFKFDIPKILTLSDCAIRVLFTKYDHLSPQCKSYAIRIKKKIEAEPPAVEIEEEKKDGNEGENTEGAEQPEGEQEIDREETKDVMAALNQIDDDAEEKPEEKEEEEKPVEEPMEEDYEISTPEPPEFEDFDGDEDVVDLRAYHPVGGIFYFDLLHMTPQPKTINNWVFTQVVDPPELSVMDYIADNANPVIIAQKEREKEKDNKEEPKEKKEERPSIEVALQLPKSVYFFEEPQVCRWDLDQKQWQLDGFTDHVFNEEEGKMTFKTSFFGKMALVQDAHINMPYQSWELRPRAVNTAVLTIIAAIVEVEIEIKDGQCCLRQPDEKQELEHMKNQWMPPNQFIKVMKESGINLFPATDSSKYVSIQNKNVATEERLYQQMAMTASAMAFSWSKWNAEVKDESQLIIQGSEHLLDEPLMEEDWSLFLVTKKKKVPTATLL